jgi:5-(carboxyamino)imidazole ribonucleotide mutase
MRVVVLAGSGSDAKHVSAIATAAAGYGLEVVTRVASAHKTPEHALAVLRQYDTDGIPTVFITVAGRSNALSAFADAAVLAPVIACPPPSDAFGGADVWSSLRLPSGVASTVVLDPGNAALAAAKMFGLTHADARAAVAAAQAAGAAAVHAADTP